MAINRLAQFGHNFQIKSIVCLMTKPGFTEQIFDILDEFSFAATYARAEPHLFLDLNSGFIGVKRNEFTTEKIKEWIDGYHESEKPDKGGMGDQKNFRKIFLKNKKEFFILPPHFHYRPNHFKGITENAVLSHDHNMDKNIITNKIIEIFKSHEEKIKQL